MKTKIFYIALFSLILFSCEQEIEIDLPPTKELIVVDGVIESDEFARVTLTKSIPYFEQIDLASLSNILITDAKVFISDGILTDTLQFTIDPSNFPPVYYKGTDPSLKGQVGKTYYLTIWSNGDTLTSSTTIPYKVPLDSIYWKPDDNQDSLGFGWGHITEPDTLGNFYRLFAKRQGYTAYLPAGNRSAFDDRLANGQSTAFNFVRPDQIPVWAQSDSIFDSNEDERFYFKRGDTIMVKFASLDAISYKFVRSYEIAATSFGNPFSAPTFVRSNIKGGLGGFVGYGVMYYTYVVPQ